MKAKSNGCGCALLGGGILLLLGMCTSMVSDPQAETAEAITSKPMIFVASSQGANCRVRPELGAQIVAIYAHGDGLKVETTQGDWSQVEREPATCWIKSSLLTAVRPTLDNGQSTSTKLESDGGDRQSLMSNENGAAVAAAAAGYATSRTRGAKSANKNSGRTRIYYSSNKKKKRGAKSRQRQNSSVSGYCPCSGRNVCVGPRGGRYCTTSGGNKRYGM